MSDFSDIANKLIQSSGEYMNEEYPVIRKIYVDMSYIQDFRFGSLLTFLKDENEYKYVWNNIKKYNNRFDEHIMKYFPDLPYKEEDIVKRIYDPKYTNAIINVSPMTSAYYNFITMMIMIKKSNATHENDSKIEITIACEYPYSAEHFKKLSDYINFNIGNTTINQLNCELYSQPVSYYVSFDLLFLYSLEKFVNVTPAMQNSFAGACAFVDKYIVAKPEIGDAFANISEKDKIRSINQMREQLNIYCKFDYMGSELLIHTK